MISIVLVVALLISVPVGMALAVAALVGLLVAAPGSLILLPQKFIAGLDSFPLIAIPLFILAGSIMSYGGIARRIIDLALVFVGRVYGGLGFVVILSTAFFGAICGSSSAKTAAIGSVMLPEMIRKKYPPEFATGLFAAAGGGTTLVPPSIDLIIMGVIANISIGGLFAAGILPTVVIVLALMGLVFYYARKLNLELEPKMPWKEKFVIIKDGVLPVLMVVIVLGGIYGGVFTPTEASAVAVVYGFILAFFVYKELKLEDIPKALLQTASLTGVVLIVLATANMFSFILTYELIPQYIANLITGLSDNWIVFVILVNIVFLLLGMVMDALPAIIVLLPILVPVGVSLDMEPIHLAILIEANVGLGMITPPVGITLFVACGISKIPIENIIKTLIPFLIVLTVSLLIISYIPEISLYLPRVLGFIGN
ncbi:MAG: TRAP transporter large permease [bacterium]